MDLLYPLIQIIKPGSVRDSLHAPPICSLWIEISFAMYLLLCGFMCCCIFSSIRIFGKLWPLQQVNDVGNFSFLIVFSPFDLMDLWQALSLFMAAYECLNVALFYFSPASFKLFIRVINSTAFTQLKHWFYVILHFSVDNDIIYFHFVFIFTLYFNSFNS